MNNRNTNKYLFRVAQKAFKGKNMLNIESNIEAIKNSPEINYYTYLSDVIFFKIASGVTSHGKYTYDVNNQVVMQMDFDEVRQLMYGCKELYKTGKTDYKNYTDPNLTSSSSGNRKELTLGLSNGIFFVNISSGNQKYSQNFTSYGFLSFIDTLESISDETERILYNYQRKNDYKIKTEGK